MKRPNPISVILTRLSFYPLLGALLSGKAKEAVYYFDLYGTSNGMVTTLVARFLGREKVAGFIEAAAGWLGIQLKMIPHGNAVKDYHLLHLGAENDTTGYLKRYFQSPGYQAETPVPKGVLDRDCENSLCLKNIGWRLWHVLENIRVVRTLAPGEIRLLVDRGEFPRDILDDIAGEEGVTLHITRRLDRIVCLLAAAAAMVGGIFTNLIRFRLSAGRKQDKGPYVAVEFVDPRCKTGKATEPNYLALRGGVDEDRIIAYYRKAQIRRCAPARFALPGNIGVVGPGKLPVVWEDLSLLFLGYLKVLASVINRSASLYSLVKSLENLQLMVDLSSLFRRYPIRAHIYNTIPNGNASTRYDSGLVTGVCRRFGVHSISYQSRVYYRHIFYYYFDAFDTYFFWGRAWKNEYDDHQFIKEYGIIGNVFLDTYNDLNTDERTSAYTKDDNVIVLFTADMDIYHPTHYTYGYNKKFLLDTIRAVGEIDDISNDGTHVVLLKTKDPEHVRLILDDKEINDLLKRYNVKMTSPALMRHDIEGIIAQHNMFISIGFTSPGFDALTLGKPSMYYTPYLFGYNSIFPHHSPLVLNNPSDIREFITGNRSVDLEYLDSLEPFRDGRAARRLGDFVNKLIEGDNLVA